MNLFFKIIILTIFLFLQEAGFADTSLKLLIPNESYKNEDQKQNEIINFGQSGLTAKEWRIKKCYRNVTFNIFWKSGLCPTDPHMCIHSYTVEELHFFKKYDQKRAEQIQSSSQVTLNDSKCHAGTPLEPIRIGVTILISFRNPKGLSYGRVAGRNSGVTQT